MMGRLTQDQGQLFYSFCLDDESREANPKNLHQPHHILDLLLNDIIQRQTELAL
jgi:hypothetical protein